MFYSQETINGGEHSSQFSLSSPLLLSQKLTKTQVHKHTHTKTQVETLVGKKRAGGRGLVD